MKWDTISASTTTSSTNWAWADSGFHSGKIGLYFAVWMNLDHTEDVASGKVSADQAAEQIEMLDSAAGGGRRAGGRILIKARLRLNIHSDERLRAVAHGSHDAPRGDALLIDTNTTAGDLRPSNRPVGVHDLGRTDGQPGGCDLGHPGQADLPIQVLLVGGPWRYPEPERRLGGGGSRVCATVRRRASAVRCGQRRRGSIGHSGGSRVRATWARSALRSPDSDVVVTADTSLGRPASKSVHHGILKAPQDDHSAVTVGAGTGRWAMSSRMGSAQVTMAHERHAHRRRPARSAGSS